MAHRPVVQVTCDRCKKVDIFPVGHGNDKSEPDLLLRFGEVELVYYDLCEKCNEVIKNALKRIQLNKEDVNNE